MSLAFSTDEQELLALLREKAVELQHVAPAISASLGSHASDIANETKRDEALLALDHYAQHYKGLIDEVVPGVRESDWFSFVNAVRRLAKEAVVRRGLDRSLLGRLRTLAIKAYRAA